MLSTPVCHKLALLLFVFCACFSLNLAAAQLDNPLYLGAEVCGSCHQKQYQLWQQSDHHKAMQIASPDSVLGDFSGVKLHFHNIDSYFYRRDNRYFVDTLDEKGKQSTFQIKYTFGYQPLQQYLVEMDKGHVQALNIAWDSRRKERGGQRWFHLQSEAEINPEHPFFWTRHFQNWNSRCAACHSSDVDKNYDAETHSYNTTWSEISVSCEACHGRGARHLELVKGGLLTETNSGFPASEHSALSWQFKPGKPIAQALGTKSVEQINMCGRCHALRSQLTEKTDAEGFHDANRLQLLHEGSYFLDGQIREEAFVLGSFLQSKMHGKGVTCGNCHNPHSGKVLIEGNGLCTQCHQAEVFDTFAHSRHANSSAGALCVNCHMPERRYMQVDDRRDHSFTIPRPDLLQALGVPNACATCHKEKDSVWASKQLIAWGMKPAGKHWASLNQRARAGDISVTAEISHVLDEAYLPAVVRATLLEQLANFPSRASVASAGKSLQDESPLLRRAAVRALQALPAEMRWQLLSPHLQDESRSVRYQLAETLADVLVQLPAGQGRQLKVVIDEYRVSLAVSADSPATQSAVALLELKLGNIKAAEKAYLQALMIEPAYVPALLNLADFYRSEKREGDAEAMLKRAVAVAPDSAAAQHSYGLLLIRKGGYREALPHLKLAFEQLDAQARYAYVYAVALDELGQTKAAVKVLVTATKRWPNQYDLLMTLVLYLEKMGNTFSINQYISQLKAIAPDDPALIKWADKYRR